MSATDAATDQSADRVSCDHGERCGGCTLLGVSERDQLHQKRELILTALARYPGLRELSVEPVVGGRPGIGYRTRAKLVVARDGSIGLYARGSHDVVDIPRCRVLGAEVATAVDAVRQLVRRGPTQLAGIDVREARHRGETSLLVTLNGAPRARAELETLARDVAELPNVAGVAVSERDPRSPTFLGETPSVIAGAAAVRDTLTADGPYHLASYGSFVQAHRGQAAAIALRVVSRLQHALGALENTNVIELYAGSGALGLLLCQHGARPLLVERFAPALALASEAAKAQSLSGLQTREGDATKVAAELVLAGRRFDAVIVNPPRRGLPPSLRAALAALGPRAIAYVSCDPETLARDLSHFALLGYCAGALEPFDLMPLTSAVETVVLLLPAPPPAITVLHEDDDLIAVDKPAHVPTTPQGTRTRSLLEAIGEKHQLPEIAPVHRLDVGTSGVCLLAKRKSSVAALALALKAGQKQYRALARGVTRDKGSVHRPLRDGDKQRDARTRYTRIELLGGHSLLRVRPDEGRTHQIRRHLAAIAHPVLGDMRYGDPASNRHFEQKHGLDRTFLHLARVEIVHPQTGATLVLDSPLPGDLAAVLARLRHA